MDTLESFIEYQDRIEDISIDQIAVNPNNPRERFNEEEKMNDRFYFG